MYREILKPIVRSPQLPQLIKELQEYWANEQQRRQEFYDWVTPDMKAEFIEGQVIVHSPVRSRHNVVLQNILLVLSLFVRKNNLGYIGVEKIMCRFSRNDYEPDLCFFDKNTADQFTDEQMIFPVPQMIVEVLSASTENRDRGVKFKDYQAHGVQEYWLVDADTNILEQYLLLGEEFELKKKYTRGKEMVQSPIIKGLQIPLAAFFDGKANLELINQHLG